jgi:hypothetical protein
MTVSANSDFNLTVSQIVKQGLQLAGLLPLGQEPRSDQQDSVRLILGTRLSELQAKGVVLGTTERTTLALSSGTASYALATDTIDITGDAMVLQSVSTLETPVIQKPWANYQELSDKTTAGIPTQMYVEKQATVRVLLWPVPNATMTLSYRRIRLFRNVDSGGVTPDVWARQLRLLVLYVAHDLALAGNLPINKIGYLGGLVAQSEKTLLEDAQEKGDVQFYMESYR